MKNRGNYRFFNYLSLRKPVFGVTLITLMACGVRNVRAEERRPDPGVTSGAVVTLRPDDAERLTEVNRLREEVMLAEEEKLRLELEIMALKATNEELREGLADLKQKYHAESESLRQLQLWLAGVPVEGTVRKTGRREEQLLSAVASLSESGNGLALKAANFCDRVQRLLRDLPIDRVRQAELQLQLDDLARESRRFIALAEPAADTENRLRALRTCRILEVDRQLRIAILSVGSEKGAFSGTIYHAGKDRQVQLRLVSVRPSVAAAEVVKGSIEDLTPGMEAAALEEEGPGISGKAMP